MAIVYEVCAIVITIFLGVLGFELALMIHSLRQLTEEAKHTLRDVNVQLPELLDNTRVVSQKVRVASERLDGKVNEAAAGMERIKGESLRSLASILELAKDGLGLWADIRKRKDRNSAG